MTRSFASALLALLASTSIAAADPVDSGPRRLSPSQMDAVTAGADSVAAGLAEAAGSFALTHADTAAVVEFNEGPIEPVTSSAGASGGVAYAIGAGPGGDAATAVLTASSADGTFIVGDTVNWTVSVLEAEVSAGFSVAVGNTGAFLFGSP